MRTLLKSIAIILSTILIAGCGPDISPNTYTGAETGVAARVVPATVVSMRHIGIDNSTGVGTTAGAGTGAVLAASAGGSVSTAIAAGIGGAVVGGVLGTAVDKAANHHDGFEYILKVTGTKKMVSIAQESDLRLRVGERVLIEYGTLTRIIPDNRQA